MSENEEDQTSSISSLGSLGGPKRRHAVDNLTIPEDGPPPKTTYRLSVLAAASRRPTFDLSSFNLRQAEDSFSRPGSTFSFGIPSRPPSTTSVLEQDPRASPFAQSTTGLTNAFDVFGVNQAAARLQLPASLHYPGPIRYGGLASSRLTGSRSDASNTSLLTPLPPPNATATSRALLSSTAVTPSNPSSAEPTPPASPHDTQVNSRLIASQTSQPNSTVQTILATLQKISEPQNAAHANRVMSKASSLCSLTPYARIGRIEPSFRPLSKGQSGRVPSVLTSNSTSSASASATRPDGTNEHLGIHTSQSTEPLTQSRSTRSQISGAAAGASTSTLPIINPSIFAALRPTSGSLPAATGSFALPSSAVSLALPPAFSRPLQPVSASLASMPSSIAPVSVPPPLSTRNPDAQSTAPSSSSFSLASTNSTNSLLSTGLGATGGLPLSQAGAPANVASATGGKMRLQYSKTRRHGAAVGGPSDNIAEEAAEEAVEIFKLNAQPLPMHSIPKFDVGIFSQAAKLPSTSDAPSYSSTVSNNHQGIVLTSAPSTSSPFTTLATTASSKSSIAPPTSTSFPSAASGLLPSRITSSASSFTVPVASFKEVLASESSKSTAAVTLSATPASLSSASSVSTLSLIPNSLSRDTVSDLSFSFANPTPVEDNPVGKLNGMKPNGTTTTTTAALRTTSVDEASFDFSTPIPL